MAGIAHANDFKRFYEPIGDTGPIPFARDSQQPKIVPSTTDAWRDIALLWEKGYRPIGDATFEGGWEDDKEALKFAKKIGAGYVVRFSIDKGERHATRRVYSSHSSDSPFRTNVIGSYGRTIGTLTGTVTTQWTETEIIPYTYTLYNQTAVYFRLLEKRGSGLFLIPPTKEGAETAGTGLGGQVLAVREGSPAYNADILPGDVITALDGQELPDYASFNRIIAEADDAPILVTLYRKHVQHQIAMTIPPEWRMAGHTVPAPATISSVQQR
jgi:hypothetical protein